MDAIRRDLSAASASGAVMLAVTRMVGTYRGRNPGQQDDDEMQPVPAVFVVTRDGDLMVFSSVTEAAGWMEAIDVDDGEYAALYTLDGRVVSADTAGQEVVLTVTDERDEAGLRHWLRQHHQRAGLTCSPEDPTAVANELMRWEWEHRWPKRPRWLARRLHGDGPPQL